MDKIIQFTALKGRLYLKMKANDLTYKEEISQLCELLSHYPRLEKDLRTMLISIAKRPDNCLEETLMDVVERSGCISKELIALHQCFLKMEGKSVDIQTEMIRSIFNNPFPEDATKEDICNFYVECTNLAITINNNKLLEEVIKKMEELS